MRLNSQTLLIFDHCLALTDPSTQEKEKRSWAIYSMKVKVNTLFSLDYFDYFI